MYGHAVRIAKVFKKKNVHSPGKFYRLCEIRSSLIGTTVMRLQGGKQPARNLCPSIDSSPEG